MGTAEITNRIIEAISRHAEFHEIPMNSRSAIVAGIDRVFGEGAYEAIAGDIYDALRAKAAA